MSHSGMSHAEYERAVALWRARMARRIEEARAEYTRQVVLLREATPRSVRGRHRKRRPNQSVVRQQRGAHVA